MSACRPDGPRQCVKTLWESSRPGRNCMKLSDIGVSESKLPGNLLRDENTDPLPLPEVSELELVRHFTRLSQLNFSIDTAFYPLGSCTMKYNPKMNETAAGLSGFADLHPHMEEEYSQGAIELLFRLQNLLAEIAGFQASSLQPAAGAQGELAGVMMIRAYHAERGDTARTKMLIPDSAHGTNPATVAMAGFKAVEIPSDSRGNVDLAALKKECDETVAGLMITNPNTLGLFEENIEEIITEIHKCGGLVYGDGANFNALLGAFKPGELDIDVMHFNLHKTFSTPHGGGGPGAGPVGAGPRLVDYMPGPVADRKGNTYVFKMPSKSIGRMKTFYGNYGMLLRAFAYILAHGAEGLREISEHAVLNANYLKALLKNDFPAKYERMCMHEFVSVGQINEKVHTKDLAKRLLDYGFHAPTVYFPLIVKEALMIEPTETESKETLEDFADTLKQIRKEAQEEPELVLGAPYTLPVKRLDEIKAVKDLIIRDPR